MRDTGRHIRHTQDHVEEWLATGVTLIEDFFTPQEVLPIVADFDQLYGDPRQHHAEVLERKAAGEIGRFDPHQFKHFDTLPYAASPAINLIAMHPAMIAFARALLDVPDVFLYQCHTWAKYTGEADYDQPFHCDFGNHTLTVPGDAAQQRTAAFVMYLTDVSDDLGAMHYCRHADAADILGAGEVVAPAEHQAALKEREQSGAAPAGALLAYSIDTFHRGTNLTQANGHRYTMTFGFKAVDNAMIGFHVWQSAPGRPWDKLIPYASPEQLACIGIPLPGDSFWTPRTLRLTRQRYPDWDMTPYEAAIQGRG